MTREIAIKIFNEVLLFGKAHCTQAEFKELAEMSIKALEQEPCEDCISRQAVINGIDNYIEKVQSTGAKDDFISFEELVVKALPSIYPKTDVLDKIRAEIKGWQTDIHDNEYDAESHDFVFERIYEIIDEHKAESGVVNADSN